MSEEARSARVIAFYLPQYHPILENDQWWGKGFTEWTNTAKAKPMFPGHYQPHVPADLGFYDLRLPETREAQAALAKAYGIDAFCYYEYWFAGRRLLERPFDEVLSSGKPDFPFCLCWANQTWTGIWHGAPDRILVEQTYPDKSDHQRHFEQWLKAFGDPRYVTVDRKPLLLIYRPRQLPDAHLVTAFWRHLAEKAGFPGLFLVGVCEDVRWVPKDDGFDAAVIPSLPDRWYSWRQPFKKLTRYYQSWRGWPEVYSYGKVLDELVQRGPAGSESFPCVIPNWDNTPRSGKNGYVLHGSTPELFRMHLRKVMASVSAAPTDHQLVFVKSWNEWAEGNHLEPDLRFGRGYLEALRDELRKSGQES